MATKPLKKQKKTWFNIVSPQEFGNSIVGETLVSEPQQLVGRNVQVNLMNMLNDPKKQNIQLTFKIKSVREKNAVTEITKYELLPSYLKRIMRKGKEKIEDSFVTETKENVKIRIKSVMITKAKTQKSKLALVRKTAREFLTERSKAQSVSEVINDAITTKLQRELRERVKKIYPLAVCEFKMIMLE